MASHSSAVRSRPSVAQPEPSRCFEALAQSTASTRVLTSTELTGLPVSVVSMSLPPTPSSRRPQRRRLSIVPIARISQPPEGAGRAEHACFVNTLSPLGRLRNLTATPAKHPWPLNHQVPHAQNAEPNAACLLFRQPIEYRAQIRECLNCLLQHCRPVAHQFLPRGTTPCRLGLVLLPTE